MGSLRRACAVWICSSLAAAPAARAEDRFPCPGGAEAAAEAEAEAAAPVPPPRPVVDHRPAIDRELDLHWVGEVGTRFGTSVIDGVDDGTATELVVGGGLHYNRVSLIASYGIALTHHAAASDAARDAGAVASTDQTTNGLMHRLGGDVRYAFWRAKTTPEVHDEDVQAVGEVYVQAGGGAEITQWDLGGRLVRPEASIGIGLLGALRTSAHRRTGWFLGVKLQVARRIDVDDAAPTCAAPCTTATPPVAWSDRSVLFETGLVFGG